jgi:endoglucanase
MWTKLAQLWPNDSQVIFGLMNEPANLPTTTWLSAANAAIAAIRSSTGGNANNLILVPGNCWTGGWSWVGGGSVSPCNMSGTDNATVMLGVVDAGNNYAFDIHQYLDSDSSGTGGKDCTKDGATVLANVTAWLIANKKRAFLSEFAGINSTACKTAVTNMLTYMNANPGSSTTGGWIGWTWWGAGPMYYWTNNSDGFYLEPSNWSWQWSNSANANVWTTTASPIDQPQVSWLTPFLQ